VGIPLAISFGPREPIELYNNFYQVFGRKFGIKLKAEINNADGKSFTMF
jgi:hypothetical protein